MRFLSLSTPHQIQNMSPQHASAEEKKQDGTDIQTSIFKSKHVVNYQHFVKNIAKARQHHLIIYYILYKPDQVIASVST